MKEMFEQMKDYELISERGNTNSPLIHPSAGTIWPQWGPKSHVTYACTGASVRTSAAPSQISPALRDGAVLVGPIKTAERYKVGA